MFRPTRVVDIELSHPLETIENLDRYAAIQALVRLHRTPIGYVTVPVAGGRCSVDSLGKAILDQHCEAIIRHLLNDGLAQPPEPGGLRIADLVHLPHANYRGPLPSITVAICTRDRTESLDRCLESLDHLEYPSLDLLVVDNAPSNDDTERLVT